MLRLAVTAAADVHVAVCFWGLSRSLWATKDSLRHSIFDPLAQQGYRTTTFLHTFRVEQENGAAIFWEQYKWLRPDHALVESVADVDQAPDTPDLDLIKRAGDPFGNAFVSVANVRLALHSLNAVTTLWADHPRSFDVVLYTRSDVWYFNQLSITELQQVFNSSRILFTPEFDAWTGVNDRFAFGHPAAMHTYGSRLKLVKEYLQHSPLHAESFLKYALETKQLEVRPSSIRFTRVRASGEIWSLPEHPAAADFSDGVLHGSHTPNKKFQRNEQGMLELVAL